jgi:MFS family permease
MLIALVAMFLQQTFASVGKTLPAVVAPLVIAELHADPAWVGVYYGICAAASLFAQMGCGSFIIRYGALRMSQVALVLLGGGRAGSVAVTGLFSAAWPIAAIGLAGAVLSATAVSWHGILLSEAARLAPAGRIGAVTGGVLSFGQIGAFVGPFAFSALLSLTGDYGAGGAACAIPALWVSASLLRSRAPAEGGEALTAEAGPGEHSTVTTTQRAERSAGR